MSAYALGEDPFDARLARGADGLLRVFNLAGVLSGADVHVAQRLARLGDEDDERVQLATALAVRAPRLGHVYADLAHVRETATVDGRAASDLAGLAWPEPAAWVRRVASSGLVAVNGDAGRRPLHLDGTHLYLDRYRREELEVAARLQALARSAPSGVDEKRLTDDLERLFSGEEDGDDASDRQRLAAASAVLRRLSVIAGGPGTGKTTTVARVVALLAGQAASLDARAPLIGLAAPTGKAAVRLEEAVHEEALRLPLDPPVRDVLLDLGAATLHRLLAHRPAPAGARRPRRLPHDVVIVDETSMVPLSLMALLVEALRADARLVLIGDPAQLASIEAGAVLGDIVGPASGGLIMSPSARRRLSAVSRRTVGGREPAPGVCTGDGIVLLERVHRFGGAIAALADAIRQGDAERAVELLRAGSAELDWLAVDAAAGALGAHAEALEPVRRPITDAAAAVIRASRAGHARAALDALGRARLLCAHRRGPYGVRAWSARVESWLATALPDLDPVAPWYAGRPLLVTENDYELGLFNGDSGVTVATADGRLLAAFERRATVVRVSPLRLSAIETLYAMTVHKSQGSQFGLAAVLLPEPESPLLTRELLYTAVTRARRRLILVASEAAVRAAVGRPIARASGLRERLWGDL